MANVEEKIKIAFGNLVFDNLLKEAQIESLVNESNELKARVLELEKVETPNVVLDDNVVQFEEKK